MKSTFRKSQILILFFTTIFSLIYIEQALLYFQQDGIRQLETTANAEKMLDNTSDTAFLYKVFVGVGILLVLNIWSVMDYWIEVRRKDIYVRKLCGANIWQQMLWMLKQFICLIIMSFLFAQIVIILVSESNFFLSIYLKNNVGYSTIGMCLIFAIICIFIGAVKLGIKKGKHWIKIRYAIFAIQMFVTALIILYASSQYITYAKFVNKVEAVEGKVSTISYAQQIKGEEFAKASEEEFEEVRNYIEDITDGECFSFEHGTIILENVKHGEKYKAYTIEDMDFYNVLYATEKVQEVYTWKCSTGEIFSETDFAMESSYIPILIGSSFEKDYQVGDVIDNTYRVKGILTEDAFFLNPRWEGKAYSLDTTIVIPMEYQIAIWGGAYVNQLNLLNADKESMELICKKISEMGMPEIAFREMSEQLEYIQTDIEIQIKMYGAVTGILLVLCLISQIAMLLYLIEIQKQEYSIRLMCGATMVDIGVRLVLPVLVILFTDYAVATILLDMLEYFWIGIVCGVTLAVVIMALPLFKLGKTSITELVRENRG